MRSGTRPGPGMAAHRRPASVIDAHRARQARPAKAHGDVLERAAETAPGKDKTEQAPQNRVAADAVRTLSPHHRAVLPETHYRGRTMAPAARVPGIAPDTVKPRTYPTLHALRPALKARGIEP
ncbi:RNA polymerase subunit sigma-24 [Streptomyces sp. PA03-6a]|nr:RNA polymerase subunit sigma-24 [Streptomyces sp. PA03-6a]